MSLRLYMDVHVPQSITVALRQRDVDVLTSQEDMTSRWNDAALVDRATALGCVLFSWDSDMRREAAERQRAGRNFSGIISATPLRINIGQCINELELFAKVCDPADLANRIEYLPLR